MGKKEKLFPISTVGGRIQKRRHELKLSRSELYDKVFKEGNAGSANSKDKTVLNWESSKTELNYDTLTAMCFALKCSSDYLLGLDECTDKSTQFIHEYTGLSETAIKRLHEFTTYHQGKIRLAVMDSFICDVQFSLGLTDDINRYFENYYLYETKKRIYIQEDKAARQLDLYDYLIHPQSISRDKLKEYKDIKDVNHFNIQKKFDDILENYMKRLYDKHSEKTPDTN